MDALSKDSPQPAARPGLRLAAKSRSVDLARRQTAIRAMGEGLFIDATRLRPVQSDAFGDLYFVGSAQDCLAYVKVTDASPGAVGVHREHWLSVPPHVASAREAVAWTSA